MVAERSSERERRLVEGAATFHTLARPGRTLRLTVLRGPADALPALTDDTCHSIEWSNDREVVGTAVVRSTVPTTAGAGADGVLDLVVDVGGDAGTASSAVEATGLRGLLRKSARYQAPVHFDALRQLRTDLLESRYRANTTPRKFGASFRSSPSPTGDAQPAVLFGMHWLELGGAERWALRTVELAREAGLRPSWSPTTPRPIHGSPARSWTAR